MLRHLADVAQTHGLRINFGKTVILTRDAWAKGTATVQVCGNEVRVLSELEAEKYLGRKLCIADMHETELRHRISLGWIAFHKNKEELCNRSYQLKDRIRLFDAAVTPVVLYGSSAWALRKDMERNLRTAWRRMLRYVFGVHRQTAETWVDFVKRSSHRVDELASRLGMENWVHGYRRRKWRVAGKLARQTDSRWSQRILAWEPATGEGRGRGRPRMRWSDHLQNYAGGGWQNVAGDEALWSLSEEGFVLTAPPRLCQWPSLSAGAFCPKGLSFFLSLSFFHADAR